MQLAVFASVTHVLLRGSETDSFQAQLSSAIDQVCHENHPPQLPLCCSFGRRKVFGASSTSTTSAESRPALLSPPQVEAAAVAGIATRNAAVQTVADYIQRAVTGRCPNITVAADGGRAWQAFTENVVDIAQALLLPCPHPSVVFYLAK